MPTQRSTWHGRSSGVTIKVMCKHHMDWHTNKDVDGGRARRQ